jgi:hypothetical protein
MADYLKFSNMTSCFVAESSWQKPSHDNDVTTRKILKKKTQDENIFFSRKLCGEMNGESKWLLSPHGSYTRSNFFLRSRPALSKNVYQL